MDQLQNLINQNEKSIEALGIGGIIFLVVIFLILIFSMVAAFKPPCQQVSEKFGDSIDTSCCFNGSIVGQGNCYDAGLVASCTKGYKSKTFGNAPFTKDACVKLIRGKMMSSEDLCPPNGTNSTTNSNYNKEIKDQEAQIKSYNNTKNSDQDTTKFNKYNTYMNERIKSISGGMGDYKNEEELDKLESTYGNTTQADAKAKNRVDYGNWGSGGNALASGYNTWAANGSYFN